MRNFGFILAALLLSSQARAATIFKCVDEAGKVTFTKNANCPRNSGLEDVVRAHNAAPSGSSEPARMAAPVAARTPRPKKDLIVIGEKQAAPTPAPEAAPRAGAQRVQGPEQPCIKMVERIVTSRKVNKDGSTRSRAEMVKVPVAC